MEFNFCMLGNDSASVLLYEDYSWICNGLTLLGIETKREVLQAVFFFFFLKLDFVVNAEQYSFVRLAGMLDFKCSFYLNSTSVNLPMNI